MKISRALVHALAFALIASHGAAQTTATRTRTHVETLASERFEGRLTGSNGERLAAEYIAAELRRIGARPLPGRTDFLLPFEFTAGSRDGGSTTGVRSTRDNSNKTFDQ